jgi:hypothetical protein
LLQHHQQFEQAVVRQLRRNVSDDNQVVEKRKLLVFAKAVLDVLDLILHSVQHDILVHFFFVL